MFRKSLYLLMVVALSFSASVLGAVSYFDGGGDGTSWTDADNWTSGVPSSSGGIEAQIKDGAGYDVVAGGESLSASKLYLGDSGPASSLTVYDDLYVASTFLSSNAGRFLLEDGIVSVYQASFKGTAAYINGGLFVNRTANWAIWDDANASVVKINDGAFQILNGGTYFVDGWGGTSATTNSYFTGTINLAGGLFIMDGDMTPAIQNHIANFKSYNHGATVGNLEIDYDSAVDKTIVRAIPDTAALNYFSGNGDGVSWFDPNNWSAGATPYYENPSTQDTYIGKSSYDDPNVTVEGGKAWVSKLYLGRAEDYASSTLTVNDDLYAVQTFVGPKGTLNINAGVFDTYFGYFRCNEININAGVLKVRSSYWYIGDNDGVPAVVNLNGGTFYIANSGSFSSVGGTYTEYNPSFTGTLDFRGGELLMKGDVRDALSWHVNHGNILAFGQDATDQLDMNYDETTGLTRVRAIENTVVVNTWPTNGISLTLDGRKTFQLNWQPGSEAPVPAGYNIYVSDPNSVTPSALNLVSDPGTPYKGTTWQIEDSYLGCKYYWRVDEIVSGTGEIIPGKVYMVVINPSLLNVAVRNSQTLDYQWIRCGDGSSWSDPLNWHSEVEGLPIPTYDGHEGDFLESWIDRTCIEVPYYSYGGNFWLGYDDRQQGVHVGRYGFWQLYRLYIAGTGKVTIDAGGRGKWGILESAGGEFDLEGILSIGTNYWKFRKDSLGRGGIKVLGDGILYFSNMPSPNAPFLEGETCNIDIYGGTVKFAQDQRTTVQDWIDEYHITAYGNDGTDPNVPSVVDMYYDSELNQTILTAREDRRNAYDPIPEDGQTHVAVDAGLSWLVGDTVVADTLYMAKGLQADLNDDQAVDMDDLLTLMLNYLDESWLAVKAVDMTDDQEINLRDFAILASEWQDTVSLEPIATFDYSLDPGFDPNIPTSYAAAFDDGTGYFWRVDSTDVNDVEVTGDVWSFTTDDLNDPMLAYNEYPVNGDNYVVNGTVELVWETDAAIDSCNVYFADSYSQAAAAGSYQTATSAGTWTCPALTTGKRYYWRIDTVEGATVRTGKVWSFKVTDTPLGLYIDNGDIKHDGAEFKGYGVNYITAFSRKVKDSQNTSYEDGFKVLANKNIPFVRVFGGGFWVNDWDLYFADKDQYFEMFDAVMANAEENNVGVIMSVFWLWYTLPDLVSEHITDLDDTSSESYKFMEQYVREIYTRYKNCPAFWGWEMGNEYNLSAEYEAIASDSHGTEGHPTTRDPILDKIDLALMRAISDNFVTAVRKVDKNRFISSGHAIRKSNIGGVTQYGAEPERWEDHEMFDVVSIHYYGWGNDKLLAAVNSADSWNMPLFVGEFGVHENTDLDWVHNGGYSSVQEAYTDEVNDMINDGITFACTWVFDYSSQEGVWNITIDNDRSYMLEVLSAANTALNP